MLRDVTGTPGFKWGGDGNPRLAAATGIRLQSPSLLSQIFGGTYRGAPIKVELVLPLTYLADRLADPQRGLSRSMLGQVDYRTNQPVLDGAMA